MKISDKIHNPRDIRQKLGLNQQEFWGMIGVTQSGGSRYESGRSMPKPVLQLLRLVHIDKIDIARMTRGDFEVISYLKNARPTLYRTLKTQATGTRATAKRNGTRRATSLPRQA
ncbi:MAG: transcriptional regulator [Betaproteobacteria bacterium]